jgi:hypothetical protein
MRTRNVLTVACFREIFLTECEKLRNVSQRIVFKAEILERKVLKPNSVCHCFTPVPRLLFLNHLKLNDLYGPGIRK